TAIPLSCHSQLPPSNLPSFPPRRSSDLHRRTQCPSRGGGLRPRSGAAGRCYAPRDRRSDSSRSGTTRHHVHLPRFSPTISPASRSEEHTSELQSQSNLVCRLLLEKKKKN